MSTQAPKPIRAHIDYLPLIQLVLAMIIWGTLGLFVLKSGLTSIDVAFFRCFIGAIILAPYCWYKGYFSSKCLSMNKVTLIMIGGVLVVLNWILLFESFRYASITLGNVSYYLQPVFLLVLGRFFFKERIPAIKYFFVFITLIGVVLTINVSADMLSFNNHELFGIACALIAGFFYSLATVIAKKAAAIPAPMITLIQLFIGTILLAPIAKVTTINLTWQTFAYIMSLGIIHTVLAFILYYQAVAKLPTDRIAVISYVDPIAAIFTDVFFFSRSLLPIQIIGIAVTLLGSYFVISTSNIKKLFSNGVKFRIPAHVESKHKTPRPNLT
ncbi:MAG: DMT family transporter [Legionellales bacterium]